MFSIAGRSRLRATVACIWSARASTPATFVLLAATLGQSLCQPAHAQVAVTALQDSSCLAERFGTANCTANDFNVGAALAKGDGTPDSCVSGSMFIAEIKVHLDTSGTNRYDVGYFIGQNGNSPTNAGGVCSVATFPESPYPWADFDSQAGDNCGDFSSGGTDDVYIQNVKLACEADPAGKLRVPYTLVYAANGGAVCTGPGNVVPQNSSKCQSGVASIIDVAVLGFVDVTKETWPAGDSTPFAFTATGNAMPAPASFNLTDGQAQRVTMPISGGSRQLTVDEIVPAHWRSAIACSSGTVDTSGQANGTLVATLSNAIPSAACTVTNSKRSRITLRKEVVGRVDAADQFTVSMSGAGSTSLTDTSDVPVTADALGITTSGSATGVVATSTFYATPGQALTLTDAMAADSVSLLSQYDPHLTCTNAFAGPDSSTDLPDNTAASSFNVTPRPGDDIECTFTNTAQMADLSITKTDGMTQYVPGTNVTYTIVATNSGPLAVTDATLSDPLPSGVTTANWTCESTSGGAVCGAASGRGDINDTGLDLPVGASATYTLTLEVPPSFKGNLVNTATITAPAGITDVTAGNILAPVGITDTNQRNNSASDTDTAASRVTISKVSLGGVGSFDFSGSNGIANQTLTTKVPGVSVTHAVQVLTSAGTVTTVVEAAPPAGYTLADIRCTGLGAGGSAAPDLAERTVTLDAAATAAGANIACTFTNILQPTLALAKTWVNAATGDNTVLTATGGIGMPSLSSTADSANETDIGVAVQMAVGDVIALEEVLGGGNVGAYDANAWACTGGGALSGSTLTLAAGDAGKAILCTITNTRQSTDVQVVKTATPDPVVSGDVITYRLTVTNNGPLGVTNAALTDKPGAGLDCTTPSSTANCSASGGASCSGSTVSMSELLGAGITIPFLPVGGVVDVTLHCKVTSTGL